jgi:geranylgeranyl reductase family protein
VERRYELVVVGAGPAGSAAALQAARSGLGPVLLIDRHSFPRPKVCAGGIAPLARGVLKRLGLWEQVREAGYPIHGARLRTPSGRDITLEGRTVAVVLPRGRFDLMLARAAEAAGVQLRTGTRVDSLLEEGGRVCGVRCGQERILASHVVVASGAASLPGVPLHAGRGERLHGCIGWFEGVAFRPHILEMVFAPELWPHYGWLFPETDGRVNVGICARWPRPSPLALPELFRRFCDRYFAEQLRGARSCGPPRCWPVHTSARVARGGSPGSLVAGEAAHLVNAFTGEGIYYALRSGELAALALKRGLARRWEDARIQRHYLSGLRLTLEPTLRVGSYLCTRGQPLLHLASRIASRSRMARRGIHRLVAGGR